MAYDHEEERKNFKEVCACLQRIHHAKRAYGNSWRKRGELASIFGNVARKFDRIDNLARDPNQWMEAINGKTNEMIENTVIDLAVYSILWCVYIKEKRPESFNKALTEALGEEIRNG